MSTTSSNDLAIRPSFLHGDGEQPKFIGCDIIGRFTDDLVGTVYAGRGYDADTLAAAFAAVPHLVSAVEDALQQIRYLHGKFQPTGTGEASIQRLENALALVRGPTFTFDNERDERAYADLLAGRKSGAASQVP